jgi:hypothetical protein
VNSVEDVDVFKLADELALKVYAVTKNFPREETYSLVDQTRRADDFDDWNGAQCWNLRISVRGQAFGTTGTGAF